MTDPSPPPPPEDADALIEAIRACRICAEQFAATATAHEPRPVVWFRPGARVLVASQAPGLRVHETGLPFNDRSGDRLRDWMGVDRDTFYDASRIAIVPMAFCFPGYDAKGSDLPPPPICAQTWRARVMAQIRPQVTLLIGAHAMRWHLGHRGPLGPALQAWRDHAPAVFCLPHPSWRNTAWLKRNPWFEAETVPALQARLKEVL